MESKKIGDYHKEMNGEVFREWYEHFLPYLELSSVTVMNNAAYHSVRVSRRPDTSRSKQDTAEWLNSTNVSPTIEQFMRTITHTNMLSWHEHRERFNC